MAVLFVHGVPVSDTEFAHDALNPVRRSFIPEILRSQNDEGSDKCQLARRASGDADWVLAGFTDWHEKFRD